MSVHYSVQPKITGRPDKNKPDPNPKQYYASGFMAKHTTVEELVKLVAEEGMLWSAGWFKGGQRNDGTFQHTDTFGIDIDNQIQKGIPVPAEEMTTPQMVLDNHPLRKGIIFIYESGSSTPEWPRFRVVFKLSKRLQGAKEYRQFSHKMVAITDHLFKGVDKCTDPSRLWYGTFSGAEYMNADGELDLSDLDKVYSKLPRSFQEQTEQEILFKTASRAELVARGLLKEKDIYAGDLDTDKEIFIHCLKHLPQWQHSGWYEDNKKYLGSAVEAFGVDVAAEVLEAAWGPWPRERELFSELQQWVGESSRGLAAGFGTVVNDARQAETWTEDDEAHLSSLQQQGIDRRDFNDKHEDVLTLEAIQELFASMGVDTEKNLAPEVNKLGMKARAEHVIAGIEELVQVNTDRRLHLPLARDLNAMLGSPFEKDELKKQVTVALTKHQESTREGKRPLLGLQAIFEAVEADEDGAGYIVENLLPRGCNLVGGPPKVGKTSTVVALLVLAFFGHQIEGLELETFSQLVIFSDDQKAATTARYLTAALKGAGIDPKQHADIASKIKIYPSLTLDADGIDRLTLLAENSPGGVFVVDSLTSTGSKLGYDENSSDISRVIYDLREAIESVDPTATSYIVHHKKKGGSNGSSHVDSFRGSSAITGAVDNIVSLEKPTIKKEGKNVAEDMTNDRVVHISGRGLVESKVVITSEFNYIDKTTAKGKTVKLLDTIKMEYIGSEMDYQKLKEDEATADKEAVKTRLDRLTDNQFKVYGLICSKRGGLQQKQILIDGISQPTVSRAVKVLLQDPPLIQKVTNHLGEEVLQGHPDRMQNGNSIR